MLFFERHKQGVIPRRAAGHVSAERRRVAETGIRLSQKRIARAVKPPVVDALILRARAAQFLFGKQPFRAQFFKGDEIGIEHPRRGRLIGRIAEPRGAERQNLPVFRAGIGEKIQKTVTIAETAYPVIARQGRDVHQYSESSFHTLLRRGTPRRARFSACGVSAALSAPRKGLIYPKRYTPRGWRRRKRT